MAVTVVAEINRGLGASVVTAVCLASIGTSLCTSLPVSAAATPRTAAPVTCDSQFHQVAGANPATATNVILNNGLAAISATDIWAVGFKADFTSGNTIGNDAPMVERWDGSSWTSIPVDNPSMPPTPGQPGGHADLNGVASVPGATTAANNVFTVGNVTYYGTATDPMHPLAENWIGTSTPGSTGWNVVTPANLGNGDNFLYGVTAIAANNVWAVGDWRQSNGDPNTIPQPIPPSRRQPLIAHWDGTSFTSVSGPDPAWNSSDRLLGVSASGANDVWAVGRSTDGGGVQHTLILHYDGKAWSITPSPNVGTDNNTLYAVAALSPTLAYAVGNFFDPETYPKRSSHTLLEKWDGTAWSAINAATYLSATTDNYLFSISALSPNNIWVGGASFAPNSTSTPSSALVEHWDGFVWKVVPSPDGAGGSFNEVNAILAITPTNVWTAGDYLNSAGTQGLTLFEELCIPPPTVTSVLPISGNTAGNTGAMSVAINGTDFNFATAVKFGATDAAAWRVDSNNQIMAMPQDGVAGTVDITVTNPAGTSATSLADTFVYVPRAISWQQYSLAGSDGAIWQPLDAMALTVAFQPSVNSMAVISGNADLWTSLAGVNQDLGILVIGGIYGSNSTHGTVVAWKESGGYAGTFSPNAAFVQTVIPVVAATQYDVWLVWKANKATTGTIYTAAGVGPNYSPTRLTAELVPATSANLETRATNSQYSMAGSDGSNWQDIDTANLTIANYAPSASGSALVSANADLWTAMAGVNQDIGIFISGGTFGTLGSIGTLVGWKESGGYGGTFSPNAAYAQTVIPLVGGVPYTIKLKWKANKNTAGTIYAAAGSAGAYSPTRLTLRLFPGGTGLQDAMTNSQYSKVGGTGSDWMPIDATNLKLTVNPTANSVWVLSGNADLWTATVGVNQDLGIFVSGGAYGTGTLVAWKESGGYGGTFSPNAAFVQTVLPLAMGVTYTIILEWKANTATSGTIYAAAGSGPAPNFSPTRLTAQLMN